MKFTENAAAILAFVANALMIFAASAVEPPLSSSIKVDKDTYTIGIRNNSGKELKIPDISLSSAFQSGYWIFLYDPNKKKLQQGWAETLPVEGAKIPRRVLHPTEELKMQFTKDDLHGYFMFLPKCFYLVTLYRKEWDGVMLYSEPSRPLYVCE